jgi:hypothetical protein
LKKVKSEIFYKKSQKTSLIQDRLCHLEALAVHPANVPGFLLKGPKKARNALFDINYVADDDIMREFSFLHTEI